MQKIIKFKNNNNEDGWKKLSTNCQLESSRILAESDSEGVTTSPIKFPSTTRVPYCKTYEENRLEEIQAESAAYYSYEPSSSSSATSTSTSSTTTTTAATYLQQPGGGKEKRTTNIRTIRKTTTTLYQRDDSLNSQKLSDLNFKILTLDEIRKRKKEAPIEDKKIKLDNKNESDNPNEVLKNAIKTLDELKTSSDDKSNKITKLSRKRSFESCNKISTDDCNESAEKKIKIDKTTTTVPPVRLCRSVQKSIKINQETSKVLNHQDSRVDAEEESGRNQVIEVRLCDSSTDDVSSRKNYTESNENLKNDDEKIIDDDTSIDDLKFDQFIDGHSNDKNDSPGDESDDVLKDIDALLTDDKSF